MLTHVVLFWAKPELTVAERADFAAGLSTLLSIPAVNAGWVGTPSGTNRPVVDRSYTFGLTVRFTDLHRWVTELPGFSGDPKASTEGKLEAIQMAWLEEFRANQ